jgi:hypothetical protein
MEEKSSHLMLDFMTQFEPKNEKSLMGKIFNKIRKRDEKARAKAKAALHIIEDPQSDFDY